MAAEWDGLVLDGRGMPLNGSFNENKGVRETLEKGRKKTPSAKQSKKKGLSPASSEQSLLSEEQEEYVVTEYIMEYTDIFEPSEQKLDFIDVQEGDAISDVTDEGIVAHSGERRAYDDTQPETPGEETPPSEDDTKGETLGNDEDSRLDNGITEEQEGHGETVLEEREREDVDQGKGIEKREQVERDDLRNDGSEPQDELEVSGKTEKVEEVEEVDDEKETQLLDDERESEEEEERHKVSEDNDDDDDEKTEVDKLLENDNIERERETKKDKIRLERNRMVSAGTQADEEKPLLYTSESPSPEPEPPSPPAKKVFTPKAYPGKVVKSVAIGTDDDDIRNLVSPARMKSTPRQAEYDGKGRDERNKPKEKTRHVRINESGKTSTPIASKHHRRENGEVGSTFKEPRTVRHRVSEQGSQSSDAIFFRSRLPQTSKRHPKRHVWLCRDSEIHRLISERAAILRRYRDEGVTGRGRKKGFPNYSEVDVLGLPSVGFSGRIKDESYQTSLPYGKHPSSQSSQGSRPYRGSSSEDEDERTNKVGVKGTKSSGTFAVGLAARRGKMNNKQQQHQQEEHNSDEDGDGCELCAAEARENEKHEKKLKELETAAKAGPHHPRNLMLGIVYSAKFLGSTNLMSPAAPNKAIRLQQAQEAIARIKVPEGEEQPSSDVDLFISTERIKVVSSEQKQTLTDHHLKTISFIADIGNIIVVMARLSTGDDSKNWSGKMPEFNPQNQEEKTAKVVCHVLETSEAQTVAKTVGQAFSIAYHDFLKTNKLNIGEIEDMEYNGILEQQKILGEELSLLADETKAKEVVIHKKYGECLSLMIVESGWGSMIPTVIIAHLDNKGPAAKSGQLNVGNQILAINGQSLVGLPLLECQNIIKAMKYEQRVALKVVFCPPTVQISINRPDTKYQLGFSVQNGMICSLMRGGIAERGGVRVGHKIIEMNGESVVAASHHHIVEILQTTIGELRMKTMPITLYKLLVGLEIPQYL